MSDELRVDAVRVAYALTIGGIDTRYTSRPGYPARLGYTDFEAIDHVGPLAGRLDSTHGIAEYDPIKITLGSSGPGADADENGDRDPGIVLGRIGYRDAEHVARLITTVDEATLGVPGMVEVDRDVSGWGFPCNIHVGAETMSAGGSGGDGSAANPWRFTGVARAKLNTAPQRHVTNEVDALKPWVTSDVVFWRWRRAILYACPWRPDGSYGDEVEVMRGFIRDAPVMDGSAMVVQLLPMTAILDRKISGFAERAGLLSTHHYVEGSAACTLEHTQRLVTGGGYRYDTTAPDGAAGENVTAPTAPYTDVFDITLDAQHPRHGRLMASGLRPQPPESIVDAGNFEVAAGQPTAPITAGTTVTNPELREAKQADLVEPRADVEALLAWPNDFLAAMVDAWNPGDHTGVDGAWADVRIRPDGSITGSMNIEDNPKPLELMFHSHPNMQPGDQPRQPVPLAGATRLLFYPIDFAEPGDDRHPPTDEQGNNAGPAGAHWSRVVRVDARVFAEGIPIRGICPGGWYQTGERYITADAPALIPAFGSTTIRITYHDRGADEERTVTARIISSAALATGYAWEVHPDDRRTLPSFGDWGQGARVEMVPTVQFRAEPGRNVLLSILHSNGGNFATDATWDREAFGAGLLTDDVDAASFAATPVPPGLGRWSPMIDGGITLREIIEPILQATNTALVMRRDEQGRCRLTRIGVGLEAAVEAVETIGREDWHSDPPPTTRADHRITNRYELKVNHADEGLGDAGVTINFIDAASIAANGDGETLEVELRGLQIDEQDPNEAIATFRDLVARWSELKAYARKNHHAGVGVGKAWAVGLGSTVLATSDTLRGAKGAWGVEDAALRVMEFEIPQWPTDGAGAQLVMSGHGANTAGINACMLVEAVDGVDPNALTVAVREYAPAEHPITGAALVDLDFFSEGDQVDILPMCDDDAYVTRTIDTIDRATRKVIFNGPHTLTAAGEYGVIEPLVFDAASVGAQPSGYVHADLAFIADSVGTLGAAGEPGIVLL